MRADAVIGEPPSVPPEEGAVQLAVDGTADPKAVVSLAQAATRGEASRLDTVIVHEALAVALVEDLVDTLADGGLSVQAGEAARRRAPRAEPASADTWRGQPGVCGVRVVGSLTEALDHAIVYAGPATAIATRQASAAERFARTVPSPLLAVNVAPSRDERPRGPARVGPAPETPSDLTCRRRLDVSSDRADGSTIGDLAGWLRHHVDEA